MPVYAGDYLLSWDPPTTNTDGSPLTDLDGYIVYYGTESGNYSKSTDVGNVTNYTIPLPDDGKIYYFVITAYDTSENESDYSDEVVMTTLFIDTTIPMPPSNINIIKVGGWQ